MNITITVTEVHTGAENISVSQKAEPKCYLVTCYEPNYINSHYSKGCASITIKLNPLLRYLNAQCGYFKTLAYREQHNETSWVAATSYPGQISNSCSNPLVLLRASHLMEIQNGSTINIPNLEIKTAGKLSVKSGGKIFVQNQLKLDENAAGAIVLE